MTPREQEAELTQGKILAGSNSTNPISSLMPWSFQQLGGQLYCRWNRGQPWSRTNLSEHTVPERSHGKHSLSTLDHGAEVEGAEVRAPTAPGGYCKCVCANLLQPCLTLCDLKDCSLLGSSVHGILQARILERVAKAFSRNQLYFKKTQSHVGTWLVVQWLGLSLLMQRLWVPSLVKEWRSHCLGAKKNPPNRSNIATY